MRYFLTLYFSICHDRLKMLTTQRGRSRERRSRRRLARYHQGLRSRAREVRHFNLSLTAPAPIERRKEPLLLPSFFFWCVCGGVCGKKPKLGTSSIMFASKQELSKHFSRNQVHGRGQRQLRVRTQRHSHGVSVFVVKAKSGVYTSSQSSSGNSSESEKNTYRRVLRYPDGYERVLIYPADYKGPSASTSSSFAQQQEINVGGEQPSQRSWDIAGLWNTKRQTQPKVIDNPTTRARSNSAEESDTSQDVEQVVSLSFSFSFALFLFIIILEKQTRLQRTDIVALSLSLLFSFLLVSRLPFPTLRRSFCESRGQKSFCLPVN